MRFYLQEGKLQEAIESLLSLEKQTRTVSQWIFEVLYTIGATCLHSYHIGVKTPASLQMKIFCALINNRDFTFEIFFQ